MGRSVVDETSVEQFVAETLRSGADVKLALAETAAPAIAEVARLVIHTYAAGRKVLLVGNGGSAADAQHLAAELIGRFRLERRPLAAIALTTDTSVLTSLANDYGAEFMFGRQVEALGEEGDVLIALSTSGSSPNVLRAVEAARARRLATVGLTGATPGPLGERCDVVVSVPSEETARIQEAHIAVGHIVCAVVEQAVAGS